MSRARGVPPLRVVALGLALAAACAGRASEPASSARTSPAPSATTGASASAPTDFPQSVRLRPELPPGSVLAALEDFTAPPYPRGPLGGGETYTVRFEQPYVTRFQPDGALENFPSAVPTSWPATLVCDLWERFRRGEVSPKGLDIRVATASELAAAIDFYVVKSWEDISGYRPWTHARFIGQLSPSDRVRLAHELVAFIAREGKVVPIRHDRYCPNL